MSTTAPMTAEALTTCWTLGGSPCSRSRITSRTVSGRSEVSVAAVASTQPLSLRVIASFSYQSRTVSATKNGLPPQSACTRATRSSDSSSGWQLSRSAISSRVSPSTSGARRMSRTCRRSRSWAINASSWSWPVRAEATMISRGASCRTVG